MKIDDRSKLILKLVAEHKSANNGGTPSCRELALKVGINYVAVSRKLRDMANEGLIVLELGTKRGIRSNDGERIWSAKQLELLALIKQGHGQSAMAKMLNISPVSVLERVRALEAKNAIRKYTDEGGKVCLEIIDETWETQVK